MVQKRSIVSPEDFEADKESLMRMLQDFRQDNGSSAAVRGRSGHAPRAVCS